MASNGPVRNVLDLKRRHRAWPGPRCQWFVVVCLCLVLPAGCGAHPPPAEQTPRTRHRPAPAQVEVVADELLDRMRQRLLLIHEVARWKWNAGKSIADEQRQPELLGDLYHRAPSF